MQNWNSPLSESSYKICPYTFVRKWTFKPNSTPQNWLVRWGLHPTYILWNCLISSLCETFNNFSNAWNSSSKTDNVNF